MVGWDRALAKQKAKQKARSNFSMREALDEVERLFTTKEDYILRAWLRHFDKDHNMQITFSEFCEGMGKLEYTGDIADLFRAIDEDESGVITLDEIDPQASMLWMNFRRWCADMFSDTRDFISMLSGGGECIKRNDFEKHCKELGWAAGDESVLFRSIDVFDLGVISSHYLAWFELDKKNQKRKFDAKMTSTKERKKRQETQRQVQETLQQFRAFLIQKHSSYLRAWRRAVDLDGSMTVQKVEFFKAVREINWVGDVRNLWKGIDKDDSGVTYFEEIDLPGAVQLAKFKEFCIEKFGQVVEAFHAFDTVKKGKLTEPEFLDACKKQGFKRGTKTLFLGLDFQARKFITAQDVVFVDQWKPPAFLTAKPSEKAANEFKEALQKTYGLFLKAWRSCLDKDSSNRCSWQEFENAGKQIKFKGDLPGAWRFLDSDLSGYITLAEIDQDASDQILAFKRWADEEFGSVKTCFKVFDRDDSRELDSREFRKSCALFGFIGNSKRLFNCLDIDGRCSLSHGELIFIDAWDTSSIEEEEQPSNSLFMAGLARKSTGGTLKLGSIVEEATVSDKKKTAAELVKLCPPRIHELSRPRTQESVKPGAQQFLNHSIQFDLSGPLNFSTGWFIKPRGLRPQMSPYLTPVGSTSTLPGKAGLHASMKSIASAASLGSATSAAANSAAVEKAKAEKEKATILQVEMLRQKIINHQPVQMSEVQNNNTQAGKGFTLNALNFSSLKNKTLALRNRTLKILGKVELWDEKQAASQGQSSLRGSYV